MKSRFALVGLFTLLTSVSAKADVCQWVPFKYAHPALALLEKAEIVKDFCHNCKGDTVKTLTVSELSLYSVKDAKGLWETAVNGKPVDLFYTWVQTVHNGKIVWANLCSLASMGKIFTLDEAIERQKKGN